MYGLILAVYPPIEPVLDGILPNKLDTQPVPVSMGKEGPIANVVAPIGAMLTNELAASVMPFGPAFIVMRVGDEITGL